MKSSVSRCLNLRNLVISFLLFGFSFSPKSLAQQASAGASSATPNCPLISASSPKPNSGNSCNLQTLAVLPASDSGSIRTPTENLYQNHALNMPNLASSLALAPGRTIQDARKSFERAARRGDLAAQVNLAILYIYGWGAPQNFGTALYWLKSAADQGEPRACTNLGILYWKGLGVRADYPEALKYFHKAADRGDTSAMVNLGFMNDNGLGTLPDHSAAADWYRRAAERGDPLAQNNLGDLYLRGQGVPQSDALAFSWFEKAALQGNSGARIKLGFLYANGRATATDPEGAYAWILAASLAGDQRGKSSLAALAAQLSPAQIFRATQRAQALQTVPERSAGELTVVR